MANIAGIKFTKDAKNENRNVTIDLKKHGEIFNPVLTKAGALEDDEFEKSGKKEFQKMSFGGKLKRLSTSILKRKNV